VTHSLDRMHVSGSNTAWEVHSDSQPGQDFIEGMSVVQIQPGRCTATHTLDRIS